MKDAKTLLLTTDAGEGYSKGSRVEVLSAGEDLRAGAVDAGRATSWLAAGIATEEVKAPPKGSTTPGPSPVPPAIPETAGDQSADAAPPPPPKGKE